jgi:hypothetical protein
MRESKCACRPVPCDGSSLEFKLVESVLGEDCAFASVSLSDDASCSAPTVPWPYLQGDDLHVGEWQLFFTISRGHRGVGTLELRHAIHTGAS